MVFRREHLQLWNRINEYVYIDLETTGFSYSNGAKIIEIAAYKVKNDIVIDKFVTLVNPLEHIPEEITSINGITDDMVKDKETIEKVMPKFLEFFGTLPLICHNSRFDIGRFLKPMLKDMYNYELPNIVLCTLEASQAIVVNISYTLGSMYRYFTGKEPENAHRAEGDVIMGVEVAKAIQKKIREDYPYIYYHLNK